MSFQEISSPPAAQAEVQVNDNNRALGQAFCFSHDVVADSGLVVGINGGNFDANAVADTTVTCTDNTTNYIVAHRTTRAVSTATGTTNWNATTTYGRLGRAVFASGALTYHDERNSIGGIFDHAAGGTAVLADGDYGDIVVSSTGSAINIDSSVLSTFGRTLTDDTSAGAARTTLGLGTAATLDSDTDVTLAANSDTRFATQKAVKAYIASQITGGASDVMIFKGVIDCSANPNYPAADAGNLYKVSVAGKIGGASGVNVEVGDTIYCLADSTASGNQATVGSSWDIAQVNIDGAYFAGGTDVAVADGGTGSSTAAGARTNLGLVIGTDVQAHDADLDTIAGLTATTDNFMQSKAGAWASRTPAQVAADLSALITPTEWIAIACSDETTALTTGTAKATIRMPYAFTVTDVRASVTAAPTGGTLLTVDVKESGSSIFSTKLTFDASEKTTTTAATPRVISDASLADDAEITINIDAVGSTIAGAGLKVYLIGHRT